jgi:YD repeat-containing protein
MLVHTAFDQTSNSTVTLDYDDASRLKTVTEGSASTTYHYDTTDTGPRLTSRVDPAGTIGFAYDASGWTYGYDAQNRLTTATPSTGSRLTYGYDGAGNRTTVQTVTAPAVTTTFDSSGLPTVATDGTTYSFDAADNLVSVSGSPTPRLNWTYTPTTCGAGPPPPRPPPRATAQGGEAPHSDGGDLPRPGLSDPTGRDAAGRARRRVDRLRSALLHLRVHGPDQ